MQSKQTPEHNITVQTDDRKYRQTLAAHQAAKVTLSNNAKDKVDL